MKYTLTWSVEIEGLDSAEQAAVEADRLLQTNRPREFMVTPHPLPGGAPQGSIFVRVERGEAKRIA